MIDVLENVNIVLNNIYDETYKIVEDKEESFNKYIEDNKENVLNCIYDIASEYIISNIQYFHVETFEGEMINNIIMLLSDTFVNIDIHDIKLEDNIIIYNYIKKVLHLLYKKLIPRRSYEYTFIRKHPNITKIQNKISLLRDKFQPEQRTLEWYEYRSKIITASSAWKIFDSDSCKNNLIYEKCKPFVIYSDSTIVNTDSPLHWGQKYEPLSIMLYEKKYNTIIEDFGCIRHDNYSFLGASPDGINVKAESPLYGRMLEIKNIVNRDITKIPKKEYWIQMQLQMEVCNLNECDFLETRFKEYDSKEHYEKDDNQDTIKGIILYFFENNKPVYEYYIQESDNCYDTWEENIFNKHNDKLFIRTIYWKLDEFSCILVLRNIKWFNSIIENIQSFWSIIEYEKENGYEHRAPKKRKSIEEKKIVEEKKTNEIIDMSDKI